MKNIKELLLSYGYQIILEESSQRKTRFSNEERFIDVWESRKGITVGIYNPETKRVGYHRKITNVELEKLITK